MCFLVTCACWPRHDSGEGHEFFLPQLLPCESLTFAVLTRDLELHCMGEAAAKKIRVLALNRVKKIRVLARNRVDKMPYSTTARSGNSCPTAQVTRETHVPWPWPCDLVWSENVGILLRWIS
jgi:hypothetical protein